MSYREFERRRRYEDAAVMMRYDANKKNLIVAYLLWFFLGYFGVHRMYLGHWFSGFLMLGLMAVGSVLAIVMIGFIFLLPLGLWWLLDAIFTYVMVNEHNNRLVARLTGY